MRPSAFARQGIRRRYPRIEVARLVMPLALAVWTVAAQGPAAETSGWQQIIKNPATTLRLLGSKGEAEPISEEIWVGSNDTARVGTAQADSAIPEERPAPEPDSSLKSPTLSTTSEKTDFAPDILRIRVPKSDSDGWALAEDTGNEARPPSQPEAKIEPEARITLRTTPTPDNTVLIKPRQPLQSEPEKPRRSLFGISKLSYSAKDVLEIQIPRLRKDEKAPPGDGVSELQVVSKPEVEPEPDTRIKLGAKPSQGPTTVVKRPAAPKSESEKSKRTGISKLPLISDFATAILSFRLPKAPSGGKQPKRNAAGKSLLASKPAVQPEPDARIKLGAKQPQHTSVHVQTSETPKRKPKDSTRTALLRIPKIPDFATNMVRIRARKPESEGWALAEDSDKAAKPPSQPEAKPGSETRITLAATPAAKPEPKAEPNARLTLSADPPEKKLATSLRSKGPGKAEAATPAVGESDEELFHTTSTPEKPAELVFQLSSDPEPHSVNDAPGAKPDREATLRVPSRPTDRPDVPTPRIARHLTARDRASHTTWEDLTSSLLPQEEPATKKSREKRELGVLTAFRRKSTPASEPAAPSKPAVSGEPVASSEPAASDEPAASGELAVSSEPAASDKPAASSKPVVPSKPEPSRRPTLAGMLFPPAVPTSRDKAVKPEMTDRPVVKAASRTQVARHVVLRIKLAELEASAAPKSRVLDLTLSKNKPLWCSLLEAKAGAKPTVLDSADPKEIESELAQLADRGAVRIRSQPTLVTVSGRAARFMPGPELRDAPFDGYEQFASPGDNGPLAVTLLPVVTEGGRIQLEVTSRKHRTAASTVRMRPGQTAVINVSAAGSSLEDAKEQLLSLGRILGIGEDDLSPSKWVVLVTPELTRPAQSHTIGESLASDDATEPAADELRLAERPGVTIR